MPGRSTNPAPSAERRVSAAGGSRLLQPVLLSCFNATSSYRPGGGRRRWPYRLGRGRAGPAQDARRRRRRATPRSASSSGARRSDASRSRCARTASGWIITSTGQTGAPVDFTIARFEIEVRARLAAARNEARGAAEERSRRPSRPRSRMTTAINEVTQSGRTVSKEDQISAKTIVLPNNVFGSYEALAARLSMAAAGSEIPIYVVPAGGSEGDRPHRERADAQRARRRRPDTAFRADAPQCPTRPSTRSSSSTTSFASCDSRFRRSDCSSSARTRRASPPARRRRAIPTDGDVSIPANGFNLAGTLTAPPGCGRTPAPSGRRARRRRRRRPIATR